MEKPTLKEMTPSASKATPLMRSMLIKASHITPPHSTLVTEHVNGCCIQCEGRPTFRRTLDGLQPTISFHWFVDCKRSNKAAVWRLMSSAAGVTPNGAGNGRHETRPDSEDGGCMPSR